MPVPAFFRSPSPSPDFVDDVDLMFERRVAHIGGREVLGYWCTLCRGSTSSTPETSFFPGDDVSALRNHVAQAGNEHYSTYRSRCRAAGVRPNPQCSPDGVILDDDTEDQPDPLREHRAFEKAMLLTHYMALVSCTDVTIDKIVIPSFRELLQFGRPDLTDDCFPTRDDVLQKVRTATAKTRTQLPDYFKSMPGKISVSVTIIKRGNVVPYIAVVAHWLNDKWEATEGALSFKEIGCDYAAEDIVNYVMKALREFGLDNKDKLGWIVAHNDDEYCMGAALRLIAAQIDPEGTTWKAQEMGARSADRVVDDAVKAFMLAIVPEDESVVMEKLKKEEEERTSVTGVDNTISEPASTAEQPRNNAPSSDSDSDMDVDDLLRDLTSRWDTAYASSPASPSGSASTSSSHLSLTLAALSPANFTLGKLFALFKRMRQNSNCSAYDYFEEISEEEGVELVLFDRRWEWRPVTADVLEGLFVKLVKARSVYDKFTATVDAKPGVKKLKNGETFRMFAMDDADWERLTIIRDFLTEQYVAASSLDNLRDKKRCQPPTAITALQMLEGYWGKLGAMMEKTKCEGMKVGLGKARRVVEKVLGREKMREMQEEGTEECERLVVGNSCFFATVLDPRVKLAYYKETMEEETYRSKVKALEDLFLRYYVPPPPPPPEPRRRRRRNRVRDRTSDSENESDDSGTNNEDDDDDEDDPETDSDFDRRGGLWFEEDDKGERDYGTGWLAKFTAKRVAEQDANGPKRELYSFLDSPLEVGEGEAAALDVLKWWASRTATFPTLSRIARDVLAVPGLAKLGVEVNEKFDKKPHPPAKRLSMNDFETMYVLRGGYAAGLVSTEAERAEVERQRREGVFRV